MKIDVVNIQGQSTGRKVDLPDSVFGIEPNEHAVWLAVKQYNAHQRQGTHKAKERGEIKGSTKKLVKQKGTGGARKGSINSPVFRGGGRVFGPRPRTYSINLNKKVKRLAKFSALSAKAAEGSIMIVEDFSFDAPQTKAMKDILKGLELSGKKALLVTGELESAVVRSGSNIPKFSVMRAQDLNTYKVLDNETIVMCESAVEKIKSTYC